MPSKALGRFFNFNLSALIQNPPRVAKTLRDFLVNCCIILLNSQEGTKVKIYWVVQYYQKYSVCPNWNLTRYLKGFKNLMIRNVARLEAVIQGLLGIFFLKGFSPKLNVLRERDIPTIGGWVHQSFFVNSQTSFIHFKIVVDIGTLETEFSCKYAPQIPSWRKFGYLLHEFSTLIFSGT